MNVWVSVCLWDVVWTGTWVCLCVSEWVCACETSCKLVHECAYVRVSERVLVRRRVNWCMSVPMCEWVSEWVCACETSCKLVHECAYAWVSERVLVRRRVNWCMSVPVCVWVSVCLWDVWTGAWVCLCVSEWACACETCELVHECAYEWVSECVFLSSHITDSPIDVVSFNIISLFQHCKCRSRVGGIHPLCFVV